MIACNGGLTTLQDGLHSHQPLLQIGHAQSRTLTMQANPLEEFCWLYAAESQAIYSMEPNWPSSLYLLVLAQMESLSHSRM